MRTMYITGVLVSMLACGLWTGCCKPVEYHYHIPQNCYGFVPYVSNSSFSMKHSAGTISNFGVAEHYHQEYPLEGCAECCVKDFGESYAFRFLGDSPAMEIHIGLDKSGSEGSVSATTLGFGVAHSSFSFEVESNPCPSTNPFLECIDSLEINGQRYYHVYRLSNLGYDRLGANADSLWYNSEKGILKFSMYNGEYWELMP